MHAALTDEAYWQFRLRESASAEVTIESPGPGALSVKVVETTDPEKFPAVVRAEGPVVVPVAAPAVSRAGLWGGDRVASREIEQEAAATLPPHYQRR